MPRGDATARVGDVAKKPLSVFGDKYRDIGSSVLFENHRVQAVHEDVDQNLFHQRGLDLHL